MKNLLTTLTALAMAIAGSETLIAAPLTLGTNWLVNGDAEAGAGSADGSLVSIPGWGPYAAHPLITAVQYQAVSGGFPSTSDPGPISRGANFFAGGPDVAASVGLQDLDISPFATEIDQGLLHFMMSGYFGGWQDQDDNPALNVYFIDPDSPTSPSAQIFGPLAAGRSSQTGLFFDSTTGVIPAGTRALQFRLIMTRTAGAYNDGYADNLSFVATEIETDEPAAVPEPGTAGFIAVALGLAWIVRRRVTSTGHRARRACSPSPAPDAPPPC